MDASENIALEFLKTQGFASIVYEPDGNIPPDFLCDGKKAVEVRRLNQHDRRGRELEVVSLPLAMKVKALLTSLGPAHDGSWFVSFQYRRPIEKWATLRRKISAALEAFRQHPSQQPVQLNVTDSFQLRFLKSDQSFETFFCLGGYSDHDSGGWVVSEMIRNLAIVIPEKSEKVAQYRARYPEWWLVLIDHIGLARLDATEVDTLRECVPRPSEWNKIVLLNPLVPSQAIEI